MAKDSGDGIDANDILGIVALIVSLIALLGTVAQVLQQYYASAAGYTNCSELVMGKWHESKRRIFRPYELRFEVQFESPVIFVSPPTNKKGPVASAEIHYVTGTLQSYEATRTMLPETEKEQQKRLESESKQVHTADNERATWVTLLSQLQLMEKDSQEWHDLQYSAEWNMLVSRRDLLPRSVSPINPYKPHTHEDHTLAVAVQAKKRSWDTMPSTVKKPYATTTICHLIEIAAMLGLHWVEFNRSTDRYRAEGNGFMLTGGKVDDLGIMFTFQIYGTSRFEENRIIPRDEIKELCHGFFWTILPGNGGDDVDGKTPADDTAETPQDGKNETPKDSKKETPEDGESTLGRLQVGSTNDMAETLVLIGCNMQTANYLRSETTKHSHLFPVAFELIGMLGESLHIPNSCYRMLPNPTPYHWDKKFFSLPKLMREYGIRLRNEEIGPTRTDQTERLIRLSSGIHKILNPESLLKPVPPHSMPLLDALHMAIKECDKLLKDHNKLTTMVLREHFQEVLRMINEPDPEDGVLPSPTHATNPSSGPHGQGEQNGQTRHSRRFNDLNTASPEEKQKVFMDIYFEAVRPGVLAGIRRALQRRQTTQYTPGARDLSTGSAYSSMPSPITPAPPLNHARTNSQTLQVNLDGVEMTHLSRSRANSDISVDIPPRGRQPPEQDKLDMSSDIWCTLVFRMLCWLLLHDFHKKDVQISKSELFGSRLPVYIA